MTLAYRDFLASKAVLAAPSGLPLFDLVALQEAG